MHGAKRVVPTQELVSRRVLPNAKGELKIVKVNEKGPETCANTHNYKITYQYNKMKSQSEFDSLAKYCRAYFIYNGKCCKRQKMPSSSVDIIINNTFFSLLVDVPSWTRLHRSMGSTTIPRKQWYRDNVFAFWMCSDWSMLRYTPSTISLEDLCMSSSMVESYGYGTYHYVSDTVYYDKDSVRGGFMCHAFDMCFKDMSYPYAIQYGNVPSFMSQWKRIYFGKQYQVYNHMWARVLQDTIYLNKFQQWCSWDSPKIQNM